MFDVIKKRFDSFPEKIGKAEKIKFGFRINIFNGNSLFLVKSKQFRNRYDIYEISENLVNKKSGFGRFMDYSGAWIEFDQTPKQKAYINLNGNNSYSISEFKEFCA